MLGLAVQGAKKFAFASPEAFLWGVAASFVPMLFFSSHLPLSWSFVALVELAVVVLTVWYLFRSLGRRAGVVPPSPQPFTTTSAAM